MPSAFRRDSFNFGPARRGELSQRSFPVFPLPDAGLGQVEKLPRSRRRSQRGLQGRRDEQRWRAVLLVPVEVLQADNEILTRNLSDSELLDASMTWKQHDDVCCLQARKSLQDCKRRWRQGPSGHHVLTLRAKRSENCQSILLDL